MNFNEKKNHFATFESIAFLALCIYLFISIITVCDRLEAELNRKKIQKYILFIVRSEFIHIKWISYAFHTEKIDDEIMRNDEKEKKKKQL